jgi:hypothetical protein
MAWNKEPKFEIYHSSTFLEWEKDFWEKYETPYLYNKFTANKVPSISFDVSFQGGDPTRIPICGKGFPRGLVRIRNHIFTLDPAKLNSNTKYGIDVISGKLLTFFREKGLVIDQSTFSIAPVQEFTPEGKTESRFVHICEFSLRNIFEMSLLEKEEGKHEK